MSKQIHKGAAVPAFLDEVITARGSKGSVDARLDVSIADDGTFGQQSILDEVVTAREGEASLDARIDQLKITQFVSAVDTATTSTSIVNDSPFSQSKGVLIFDLAITPLSASSQLLVLATYQARNTGQVNRQSFSTLFRDSAGTPSDVAVNFHNALNEDYVHLVKGIFPANATVETKFKVRFGVDGFGDAFSLNPLPEHVANIYIFEIRP